MGIAWNILRNTDPNWIRCECLAWNDVLDDLAAIHLDYETRDTEQLEEFIKEARDLLIECNADKKNKLVISAARKSLMKIIQALPDDEEFIEGTFILQFSTHSLVDAVEWASNLDVEKLPRRVRERIKKTLLGFVDSLGGILAQTSSDLDSREESQDDP